MPDMDPFTRPDPAAQRAGRTYAALMRLADRHADTPGRRARQVHPSIPSPHEVVRLVAVMAGGSVPAEAGEPEIDTTDLIAALTLLPQARAELDATELGLLKIARGRGMTWQDIAFSLGLSTPQAARQRCERLEARSDQDPAD
ncbi:hypothetical protein FHS43_001567 [Streptosporangium becharense]|uniref:DNA-binding protein n=1 Tax=Streptosporangium becharense TaxID=1816182 RepID=A0A7W9MJA1_9ACTN|nr:DNA-binding protein [Streptosporangium becharense]MBB2910304.1 hypothetical protein [Streptosporangium becharense]MBB5823047.1 hypothetical protein [Streptosporangium becharense]